MSRFKDLVQDVLKEQGMLTEAGSPYKRLTPEQAARLRARKLSDINNIKNKPSLLTKHAILFDDNSNKSTYLAYEFDLDMAGETDSLIYNDPSSDDLDDLMDSNSVFDSKKVEYVLAKAKEEFPGVEFKVIPVYGYAHNSKYYKTEEEANKAYGPAMRLDTNDDYNEPISSDAEEELNSLPSSFTTKWPK